MQNKGAVIVLKVKIMNLKNICFSVASANIAAIVCFSGASQAVTVGNFNASNCYPFSCAASDGETVYQQIYTSSAFSGTTSFDSIDFFKSYGTSLDSATYDVSFSTTSKFVSGLDTSNYLNNIGSDSSSFGTFNLSGLMPDTLSLSGNTFNYDPNAGNLLMTVLLSNLTEPHSYQSFFQADSSGSSASRLYSGGLYSSQDSVALVTRFNTTSRPVPVPGMALGLLISGSWLAAKHRKTTQSTSKSSKLIA